MLTGRHSLRFCHRQAQRGLSLVEMMVGIAVGLIVVAGASMLVSSQLGENRRLLVETQLQQDMRATMDIIARELRRMGAQREAVALLGLASPGGAVENPMAVLSPTVHTAPGGPGVETLDFHYQPSQGNDDFGFRRNGGVVQSKLSAAGWQELTDPNVMTVTALSIKPTHSNRLRLPCPKLCPPLPGGGPADPTDCWPEVMVRDVLVEMTAHPRNAPTLPRTLRSHVRVRNDIVKFNISSTEICPA